VLAAKPADVHHLRFAQSRTLGSKVSDEFTVPLCRGITGSSTEVVMKSLDGRRLASMRLPPLGRSGCKHTHCSLRLTSCHFDCL
jgi:hypothetical protein